MHEYFSGHKYFFLKDINKRIRKVEGVSYLDGLLSTLIVDPLEIINLLNPNNIFLKNIIELQCGYYVICIIES